MGLENLGNFGIGSVGPIFLNVAKILLIFFAIILLTSIVFGVAYYFFRPMLYRIDVSIIAERQGHQVNLGSDKGRVRKIRRDFFGFFGPVVRTRLELLKRKVRLPTPPSDKVYPNDLRNSPGTIILTKRGEKDYRISDLKDIATKKLKDKGVKEEKDIKKIVDEALNFVQSQEYSYTDLSIDSQASALIEPLDDNLIDFVINEVIAVDNRNKPSDWLQRNQVIIAAGMVVILVGMGFYVSYKYHHILLDSLGSAVKTAGDKFESFNQCKI